MGVIFLDHFTEVASDTILDSHTPDTGTSWTKNTTCVAGRVMNAVAATDTAKANGSSGNCKLYYIAAPSSAVVDYDVEVVTVTATTFVTNPFWLVGRWTDTDNFYSAGSYIGSATADKKIRKRVATTSTELASGDNGASDGDTYKFEIRDAAKKLFQNSVEIISTTDNALTTAGQGGLGEGAEWSVLDDVQGVWVYDDFTITEVASATTILPQMMQGYYA